MRLELTRRGDYAVRAMLALADRNSALPTSGREFAAEMGIPLVEIREGRPFANAVRTEAARLQRDHAVAWADGERLLHEVGRTLMATTPTVPVRP